MTGQVCSPAGQLDGGSRFHGAEPERFRRTETMLKTADPSGLSHIGIHGREPKMAVRFDCKGAGWACDLLNLMTCILGPKIQEGRFEWKTKRQCKQYQSKIF